MSICTMFVLAKNRMSIFAIEKQDALCYTTPMSQDLKRPWGLPDVRTISNGTKSGSRTNSAGSRTRLVMVVETISEPSGRDLLSGIFHHLSGNTNWKFILVQDGAAVTESHVREAVAEGLDGFILSRPCSKEAYAAIAATGMPCIHIYESNVGPRHGKMRFVANDNYAVGSKAAAHLLLNGDYAAFAFVGGGQTGGWVAPRLRGFSDSLAAKGRKVEIFPDDGRIALRDWLRQLPKPVGVFAACDAVAAAVMKESREAGLSIPRHIALLGVDDALHEVDGVGLSSVRPGHFEMGDLAARMLDGLMEGRPVSGKPILVMPQGVAARASTNTRKTAARLVMVAREFIRENACSGIVVADVVARVGVSRSTLEHRFREVTGSSVRQAIEAVQLSKAKQRLASGRGTLGEIAKACGFSSANRLSHVFTVRFGKAPAMFRKNHT